MKKKLRQLIKKYLVAGGPTGALAGVVSIAKIQEVYNMLSPKQKALRAANAKALMESRNAKLDGTSG